MTTPRNAELWRLVLDSRLLDVHTAMPCEVVSFDATEQTITAKPLIKNVVRNLDGSELLESYPEIRSVPVLWPRAGGFVIAYPLSAGDPVTVLFNEWSIDNYLEKGREDHPIDLERHAFSGAVAMPIGPYQASDTISETIDALILGHDGGAVIRIATDGSITLAKSGQPKQPAALGDDVKTELDKLASDINALKTVMAGWVVSPTDGGAALKTAATTWYGSSVSIDDVGSAKVEIEE